MEQRQLARSLGLPGDDLFNVLTNAVPGFVWLTDRKGEVRFVNDSWCAYTGLSCNESLGEGWLAAIHADDITAMRQSWADAKARALDCYEVTIRCRRGDGAFRWHMVRVRRIPGADGHWIGCSVDVHDRTLEQHKDAFQLRILETVAVGADLDTILNLLCEFAETRMPGAYCSILLVDAQKGVFIRGVAPSLPAEMIGSADGVPFGPNTGSCGTAAWEKRDVIVSDIAADPLWKGFRHIALPYGMRACWSRPVLSSKDEVLATFGFYYADIRSPTEEEMGRMRGITHLAAMSIERVSMLAALKESEEHYRHMVELNPQMPWTADPRGRVLTVSSKWIERTGLSAEESLARGWLSLLHPDDASMTREGWREAIESGMPADLEYRIRFKDGQYRWMRARAAPRRDEDGNIMRWYGTLEDVHEHKLAEDRLRQAAYEDNLTRMPNRRRFEAELADALTAVPKHGLPVGLVMLDLDDFKLINDRFGHSAGDAVLRLFAQHLKRQVGPTEFAARLGGDEFAVILPGVADERAILERAEAIATGIDRQLRKSAQARNSRASAGCAISQDGDSAEDLMKKADLALYDSKAVQRGAVRLFTPAIRNELEKRSDQIELARKALHGRWIVPHYQPKLSLADGRVVGLEALVRVNHPEQGLLSPASIVAALDHTRLGQPIASRMMSQTLTDIKRWNAMGLTFGHVALNLSGETLVRPDFPQSLLKSLKRMGVPADQIQLEITERVLLDGLADTVSWALDRFREAGIKVSLDDFGTGFASLTHLRRFPVDEIKIDRSFIQGLSLDSSNAAIVKAMINLGRNLGMNVVAEGVEEATQSLLLRSWGCQTAQGFLYSRPLPADVIPAFLQSQKGCPAGASRPGDAIALTNGLARSIGGTL